MGVESAEIMQGERHNKRVTEWGCGGDSKLKYEYIVG